MILLDQIKLYDYQLVVEALTLMRNYGMDQLPLNKLSVYENGRIIGQLSYQELMDFLDHEHAGGNIHIHKLCFDLGSTLILIRDMKRKARKKQTSQIHSVATILTIIGIALPFFRPDYFSKKDAEKQRLFKEGTQIKNTRTYCHCTEW